MMLPNASRHELYAVVREVQQQKRGTNSTVLAHLQSGDLKATLYVGDPVREIGVPPRVWNDFRPGQFKIRVRKRDGRSEKKHFGLSADYFVHACIDALLSPLLNSQTHKIEDTVDEGKTHLPSIARELKSWMHGHSYAVFVRQDDWLAYARKMGIQIPKRGSGGRPKIAGWDMFWREVAIRLIIELNCTLCVRHGNQGQVVATSAVWGRARATPYGGRLFSYSTGGR
jgi:hypothetical protein